MSASLTFSAGSIFYILLLTIAYFSKSRLRSLENKIYGCLILCNLLGTILATSCYFTIIYRDSIPVINELISKGLLVYYLSWITIFTIYVFVISYEKDNSKEGKNNHFKKVRSFFAVLSTIIFFLIIAMPLYYHSENGVVYSYGPSANMLYIVIPLYMMSFFIYMLRHLKYLKNKKYLPLFLFILIGSIVTVIQRTNPGLLLMTAMETFITVLMYFTIENPDIKMLSELYENKRFIEKSAEDTSNFLFRMTQDIKKPISDIIDISNDMISIKDVSELKDGTKIINNKAKELDYLVNDALDVSSMNTKNVKMFNTRYNPSVLFNEIKYQSQNSIDKDIKFEFSMSNNLPPYLYGDSIKLKQMVFSAIDNSIKNTKSGFISLSVDSIIKYDVCRLLINISDSGKGMGVEEVNHILSLNIDDLSKVDLSDDKKIYGLKEIKKLSMILGGNLIVKSDLGKGTDVSITIDQKVVESKNYEISKKLDIYEQSLHDNKRIMVVDDDASELAKITSYLEKHEAIVSGSLFGRDLIEKISNKHKFDLIIVDDETSTYSGYILLKELKKNKKFNTPVVIMINDDKEFIKLHYLKDGFADVIMKSKLKSEVDRIIKRF